MSSARTTLYTHAGTRISTDIGPANGGILHSITISQTGPLNAGSLIVRDGGRRGAIICQLDYDAKSVPLPQLKWEGIKINGQLNLTLGHVRQEALVEMSHEVSTETSDDAPIETSDEPPMEISDEALIETSD